MIEKALKNRIEFAARQLTRAIVCVPYIQGEAEKQRVANDVFSEFHDALGLTEKWNTPATIQLYEDNMDMHHYGRKLCTLAGINMEDVDSDDSEQDIKEVSDSTRAKKIKLSKLPVVTESEAKKEAAVVEGQRIQVLSRENPSTTDKYRGTACTSSLIHLASFFSYHEILPRKRIVSFLTSHRLTLSVDIRRMEMVGAQVGQDYI